MRFFGLQIFMRKLDQFCDDIIGYRGIQRIYERKLVVWFLKDVQVNKCGVDERYWLEIFNINFDV